MSHNGTAIVRLRTARGESWLFGQPSFRRGGFTLVEVLIAIAIVAMVLSAVHAVFFTAIHLRNTTSAVLERTLPREEALEIIQRDLANLVGSTNGQFLGPLQTDNPTNALPNQIGPDFYTSNGELDGMTPWGNVQKIDYLLAVPTNGVQGPGRDLIRAVTRNLLPINPPPQPDEEHTILSGVDNVTFLYYDGTQWDPTWDSVEQTNLPQAIKVQIQMASARGTAPQSALELVVPVDVMLTTNTVSALQ